MIDLLITNARPMGGADTDIAIAAGRIVDMKPHHTAEATTRIDAAGRIAIPGLVEAHTHLDKTLIGMGWYRNEVGPRLIDRIDNERRQRRRLGIDPQRQSARQVAQTVAHGTTHIRSHVDVDTEIGITGIQGVLETRDALADFVDIDIVAFPQSGLLIRPGTRELMDAAMRAGADVVGGLDSCAIDRDPKGHLDAIFGLAETHGKPIDIHLHETGEMGAFSMELIIARTLAHGMQGRVVISHAFCLGTPDEALVAPLIDALAKAGIAIMTTGPAARPAPPAKRLRAAGVTVCTGNDGIRDTWGPYGSGDMLERAMLLGLRNNFRRDDELALALNIATHGGATTLGVANYGLAVGCTADLVLLEAETLAEAVATRPGRRLVLKAGRITAQDGVPNFSVA